MQVKSNSFGEFYHTNCYIYKGFIIDPGIDATEWVLKNVENPKAILLTHGHFDHTWSVSELQKILKIPVYLHKDDNFMAYEDILNGGLTPFEVDVAFEEGEYEIEGVNVKFRHFAGHTPGTSTIEIDDFMFSGDFIFRGSIGRSDFPYSSQKEMKKSLKKFLNINYDKIIFAGHGAKTTIKREQEIVKNYWLEVL